MNSELLYLFAHVAGTSCITSSAETLGMSRPALSMRIRQLECEIGVQLFRELDEEYKSPKPVGDFLFMRRT